MVPLTEVPTEFAGRVIVAKLGSAGILAELRGVSRVYPSLLGQPLVWVEASEFDDARELIVTDAFPSFEASPDPPVSVASWTRTVLVVVAVVVLVSFVYGIRSCGASPTSPLSPHSPASSRVPR
jgi:hypothetical protein